MAEIRGLVKLFGKTFPVLAEGEIPAISGDEGGGGGGEDKDTLSQKTTTGSKEKDQDSPNSDDTSELVTSSTAIENHKPTPVDQEATLAETSKAEEQNDASKLQEKTIKKPDKILPCPRCNSLDTKFCYYNNYNVNQPRHFCKHCQRYWTAGGTMRNVPVGAGRRKNKNSSSHYRHLTISEASLQTVQPDITDAIHHPPLTPNGTVLSFGSDMPLCESMASVLNLAEKTMRNHNRNGFHRTEEQMVPFSCGGGENGEEHSSGSSVTASNSNEGGGSTLQEPAVHNYQGYPPQIPCFNGSPWPYPWNATPAFCTSSFPVSFYPATAYWSCAVPGAWSIPCLTPVSPPPNTISSGSSPKSPLGKHSRDGSCLKPNSSEKADALKQTDQDGCIWIPKTLRIDDPDEAAKSSIWATMGIKNDKADAVSGGGLFKAFHQKGEIKNHTSESSHALHANPAALSRSLNFQESL